MTLMLFSQRQGITSAEKAFQHESIDEGLKNRLWNLLKVYYWDQYNGGYPKLLVGTNMLPLFSRYWHDYFEMSLDTMPSTLDKALDLVRAAYSSFEWYEVYNFVEFNIKNDTLGVAAKFSKACNQVLEKDNAAYRVVDSSITEITSQDEIAAIEESAIGNSSRFSGASAHIESALSHLSDRQNPNYRNSIKESISAVESVAQALTRNPKATLGDALTELEKYGSLHGAIKAGFSSLYGYTSDADGIRHAMLGKSNVSFADAKFMLVACSAFVNYLIGKSAELGISAS